MSTTDTDKPCAVLKAIIQYKQQHDGISPSFSDLTETVSMGKSVLQKHIHVLIRRKLLYKTPGTSRNLAVVSGKWEWGEKRPFPPNRLADVLTMIIHYKTTHDGNAPGHRDIADNLGLAYAGSIKTYLDTLTEMGYLTTAYASDRAIMIVGGMWTCDQSLIKTRCPEMPKQKTLFSLDAD